MQVLVLSPRVAPGLLTIAAWDALRDAQTVWAVEDGPHIAAITAAGVAVRLSDERPTLDHDALWIAPPGDLNWARSVAAELMAEGSEVEIVLGSYDLPGSALLDVVEVLDRLRRQCPWTREQTHRSLTPYLLEEAHEVLEALDSGDGEHLREELGDLLMQVVFHARIAADAQGWDIDDVAADLTAKLIHRNPHVFADETVSSVAEVDANWERLKASRKQRRSAEEGIPASLPALAYADKVLGRLGSPPVTGEELGDQLLALVAQARARGVDAEGALRRAVRRLLSDAG